MQRCSQTIHARNRRPCFTTLLVVSSMSRGEKRPHILRTCTCRVRGSPAPYAREIMRLLPSAPERELSKAYSAHLLEDLRIDKAAD